MIGTDDDGGVSGDDCTAAEASAECSDMRGKLYLSGLLFTRTFYRVFILRREYPMRPSLFRMYKGKWKMGNRATITGQRKILKNKGNERTGIRE
jgi:hypothetical protein